MRTTSRQKLTSKDSSAKMLDSRKGQEAYVSPDADGHLREECYDERFNMGGMPSYSGRGVTLFQIARITLCKKKTEEADFSEADLDAMEGMEDFWSTSEQLVYRHHVVPREPLYVPKE